MRVAPASGGAGASRERTSSQKLVVVVNEWTSELAPTGELSVYQTLFSKLVGG